MQICPNITKGPNIIIGLKRGLRLRASFLNLIRESEELLKSLAKLISRFKKKVKRDKKGLSIRASNPGHSQFIDRNRTQTSRTHCGNASITPQYKSILPTVLIER